MRLVVIEVPGLPAGATQTQEFDFQSDPYRSVWLIGRQLGSNIHLVDPSVSRAHAEIIVSPQGLMVRDLGSANGTFINEQPVSNEQPVAVRPGDRLRVGNVVTLLEAPALNAAPNEPTLREKPSAIPTRPLSQSPRGQLPPTAALHDNRPPAAIPPLPAFKPEPPASRPVAQRFEPATAQEAQPLLPRPTQEVASSERVETPSGYVPLPSQAYPVPEPRYAPNPSYAPETSRPRSPSVCRPRPPAQAGQRSPDQATTFVVAVVVTFRFARNRGPGSGRVLFIFDPRRQ